MGVWVYPARSIGQYTQVRSQEYSGSDGEVIPHFRNFPLQSAKQADVERFDAICQQVAAGQHLERNGFEQVVRIAMQMNPTGKRKYPGSEILSSLRSDEGIVYATGNGGIP